MNFGLILIPKISQSCFTKSSSKFVFFFQIATIEKNNNFCGSSPKILSQTTKRMCGKNSKKLTTQIAKPLLLKERKEIFLHLSK
jgi:hypothetical protein